ncbi:beta-1,3-glucosyltransferase isoform X1 [Sitophilus oryzae]|uniref:Beta-1,3-glucosyltransferase isoform X1 n=1 Tax=Sitophilus oryzae TaxID=7048 RepID=A0A6J2XIT1_SITOR|nr:beta-1,3-glucosyltransferase isoform X1 [Sitophilus oryzae]
MNLIMMHYLVFMSVICFTVALESPNITIIILSQNSQFNVNYALTLKEAIQLESSVLSVKEPKVYFTTKEFNISGDWTFFPLISPIVNIAESCEWVVFVEDRCTVSLKLLINTLQNYDAQKEIWIGNALHDTEASIIHHFGFYKNPEFFKYPNIGSGIVFSMPLLKRLESQLENAKYKMPDFHIDSAYELALFVYNDGKGPMIVNDNAFCSKEGPNCATYPRAIPNCGKTHVSSIFFAVKTCQKFHVDRIKAVKKTWGQFASKIMYFSDVEDASVPTVSLGVKNTDHGHCEKTMSILKFVEDMLQESQFTWLVLVDDDTVLSVSRIASLTRCYDTTEPIMLGERYRFGGPGSEGFDYATGGAGILINQAALQLLADSCKCSRPDSPDDMILGACAEKLGITIIHIPQMHQARPPDYAEGRLATMDAITFHKHWMIDPVQVYREWFEADDKKLVEEVLAKVEL